MRLATGISEVFRLLALIVVMFVLVGSFLLTFAKTEQDCDGRVTEGYCG